MGTMIGNPGRHNHYGNAQRISAKAGTRAAGEAGRDGVEQGSLRYRYPDPEGAGLIPYPGHGC